MGVVILRSNREIEQMRKAGLLVWQAHQQLIEQDLLRPGVKTAQLDAAIEAFFIKNNATPLFKGVPGVVPYPATTCISINEEVVHGIPGERELQEGDIVSIDTGCKAGGWCGDAAVTRPVGTISKRNQKLLDVTRDVLHLAIDSIAECDRWSQVAERMERFVKKSRFAVVEDLVGHGIGRTMHEDPQVPNYVDREFRRHHDFDLKPGLVIAIEPMVNVGSKHVRCLSDHWTIVTVDESSSAHFEHTVAVTSSGPVVLTAGPNGESW